MEKQVTAVQEEMRDMAGVMRGIQRDLMALSAKLMDKR